MASPKRTWIDKKDLGKDFWRTQKGSGYVRRSSVRTEHPTFILNMALLRSVFMVLFVMLFCVGCLFVFVFVLVW